MSEKSEIIWKEIFNKCKEENVWTFHLEILQIDLHWTWHDIYVNGKKIETTENFIDSDDLRELCDSGLIKYSERLESWKEFKTKEYHYEVLKKDFD